MKIKSKKTLNLPQLIEWAWDNNVKNERYRCSDSNPHEYVWINENSDVELDEDIRISKSDTFTIEVEEEITEDTVIPELVMYCKNYYSDSELINGIYKNKNINSFVNHSTSLAPISFYILNDDLTMTLIWRDGKMVE